MATASEKREVLRKLSFGNQVAEEERDTLKDYFVKTQAWDRINNGDIDIIYGPKGAGKSALYFLIQENPDDFFDRRVLLIAAENPQGAPAFKDLEVNPPTTKGNLSQSGSCIFSRFWVARWTTME